MRVSQRVRQGIVMCIGLASLTACGGAARAGDHYSNAGALLPWHTVSLPAGVTLRLPQSILPPTSDLAVAASDGAVAYACAVTPSGATQLWGTTDQGQDWSALAAPSSAFTPQGCEIMTDQLDAGVIALTLDRVNALQSQPFPVQQQFLSYDGGKTWSAIDSHTTLTGSTDQTGNTQGAFATRQGVTVGLESLSDGPIPERLVRSQDHGQTWQTIDDGVIQSGMLVTRFWVNSSTGALLALTRQTSGTARQQLWQSLDGGQHWIALPRVMVGDDTVAATPSATGVWQIVEMEFSLSASPAQPSVLAKTPNHIVVSVDGGQSWREIQLDTAIPSMFPPLIAVGFASQGREVFVLAFEKPAYLLYRLTISTGQWSALGTAPAARVIVTAGVNGSILWSLSNSTTPGVYTEP